MLLRFGWTLPPLLLGTTVIFAQSLGLRVLGSRVLGLWARLGGSAWMSEFCVLKQLTYTAACAGVHPAWTINSATGDPNDRDDNHPSIWVSIFKCLSVNSIGTNLLDSTTVSIDAVNVEI